MRKGSVSAALLFTFVFLCLCGSSNAQAPARGGQRGAPSAQSIAPIELTGTWVAVISEDWRHRMVTPRKGDFESLTLNAEGQKVANNWDIARDNQAALQCKAFGIGGIIRQPGRIRISWQDENTLKMDFDAGTQTRLLNFDKTRKPGPEKSWQGHSIAEWEGPALGRGGQRGGASQRDAGGGGQGLRGGPAPPNSVFEGGSIKVVTTNFREGYLRKNGVPYSETATITEHIHRLPQHPNGDNWLLVITVIDDPKYLTQPFYTSTQFKLEPNASKFSPTPCRTAPPPAG